MKITRALSVALATGVSSVLLLGVAPSAQAATTWVKTPATKANAYSWNGYRATVSPAGFSLPKGYVKVSTTESIKKGTTYVARGVTSARLAPGTYTVYSTFKYRSRSSYTAYRTHSLASSQAESCTIESGTVTTPASWEDFSQTVTYTGTCTWTETDYDTWDDHSTSGPATWTEVEWTDPDAPSAPYWADGSVRDWVAVEGTVTWRTPYTAYRYGTTKTASRYRTATVTKVLNTSRVTLTEFRTIDVDWDHPELYGSSKSEVARIFGTAGTRTSYSEYSDGDVIEFRRYQGTNEATVSVGYVNGYAYTADWYS